MVYIRMADGICGRCADGYADGGPHGMLQLRVLGRLRRTLLLKVTFIILWYRGSRLYA